MKHPFNKEALKVLLYWITERERIRIRKEQGHPQPWTKDPILGKYRFCNVDRNDDRVTRWVFANWLNPHSGGADLWFAMVVARLLNLPSSLAVVAPAVFAGKGHGPVRWDRNLFVNLLHLARQDGNIFNAAYIVSTNGHKMDKVTYLADRVLTPLWDQRKLAPAAMRSLEDFHTWLQQFDGLGSFMAAQVVADIKYDPKSALAKAPDFETFAASGPGSRRGMHRLFGRDYTLPYKEQTWRADMGLLRPVVLEHFRNDVALQQKLTAQNIQNALCEFDKMMRALNGEGEPKQLYRSKG